MEKIVLLLCTLDNITNWYYSIRIKRTRYRKFKRIIDNHCKLLYAFSRTRLLVRKGAN